MKVFGNVIILFLLFITNARIIFVKRERKDGLVILAPVSFILIVLHILAWKVDVFSLYTLVLSLLVLFSNFHALFRYSERLYIDHYSTLMKIWSIFTCIFSLIGMIFTIYFAPTQVSSKRLNLTEKKINFKGSFGYGFEEKKSCFSPNFVLTQIYSGETDEQKEIIIILPDKRGETENYKPFMQELAQRGYNVFSADFYSKDCKWLHNIGDSFFLRRLFFVARNLSNSHSFNLEREFFSYNSKIELQEMYSYIEKKYGKDTKVYIISDFMANIAVKDFSKEKENVVNGFFFLDECEEYSTKGYGFIRITNPILAKCIGEEKDYNKENLKKVVDVTETYIKECKHKEIN